MDDEDEDDETLKGRKATLIEDIQTNDGNLFLEIVAHEVRKKSGKEHTVYIIKGRDNLGMIDIQRRYREMLFLRDMLYSRYPGLMIPPMPGKQYQGNTHQLFVEERKHFLNMFLKQIGQ
jgi:hypothetical protein